MGAELDVLLKNIRACYTKKRRGDQKRFKRRNKINKRPMGHIAHLRKTVQINKHNVD